MADSFFHHFDISDLTIAICTEDSKIERQTDRKRKIRRWWPPPSQDDLTEGSIDWNHWNSTRREFPMNILYHFNDYNNPFRSERLINVTEYCEIGYLSY